MIDWYPWHKMDEVSRYISRAELAKDLVCRHGSARRLRVTSPLWFAGDELLYPVWYDYTRRSDSLSSAVWISKNKELRIRVVL